MIPKAVFLLGLAIAASGLVSPPVALALGLVFGFSFPHPFDQSAKKLSRHLLQASVVGLGFGMNLHDVIRAGRSGFLYTVLSISFTMAVGMAFGAMLARADDLPQNPNPRAIFGDSVEPDWDQRLTVTVGPKKADLVGTTDRAIQAGVDYVARLGGGTVRVLPGTYRLRNSIFLQSKVRILGSGADSVLFKEPSVTTKLTVDGDHWDQEITLADPKGFQVGDGVRLVANPSLSRSRTWGRAPARAAASTPRGRDHRRSSR